MRATKVLVFFLITLMFGSVLILGQAPEASASDNPCPNISIRDVFNDPDGNWDGDLVNNSDELFNGLKPCLADTAEFCAGGGNPLCNYPVLRTGFSNPCIASINAFPNGDFDNDGVSNSVEIRNGANPCTHPCPNPRNVDLALTPNGSWDNDGVSNAVEVNQGTNPCDGFAFNPCPYYSTYQINYMPGYDWDGDGFTNLVEYRNGTNPCVFNSRTIVKVVPAPVVVRLPHVDVVPTPIPVFVAPQPTVICPTGFPYYHPGTNLCYANPVRVTY